MEAATATAPTVRQPRLRRAVSDERLVERLRAGDEVAFEVLYDRYHGDLLAFCRHMVGNREEAEDVLQHVFVAAHRHLREPGRDIQLRPWLYAVARNRCLSVLRARHVPVALEDVPEPEAAGLAVAAEVEQRQDLKDMLADLARLPEDQRAALVLAEIGALSHDEIADALEVRREKVKALVFQAREALMGWREARDTDCQEIQEQLATLRGGALRRAPIRRHVETCPSCAAFREEVRRQRAALALVLPVIPSVALKQNVLAAALTSGSVAGAGALGGAAVGGAAAAGGGIGALGSGLVTKGLVVAALAAGAGGGGYLVHESKQSSSTPTQGPQPSTEAPTGSPTREATPAGVVPVGRGPVEHVPGTPVRRGPVAHSKGRGPQASGNRGRHLGSRGSRGNGTQNASPQGQAHRQGALRRPNADRAARRTPKSNSSGGRRPAEATTPGSRRRSTGQSETHRSTTSPQSTSDSTTLDSALDDASLPPGQLKTAPGQLKKG